LGADDGNKQSQQQRAQERLGDFQARQDDQEGSNTRCGRSQFFHVYDYYIISFVSD